MWRDIARRALVATGIIPRPDLVARVMDRHPTPGDLPPGVLVVVQDGDRAKWACLRCPGGCGEKLQLSLSPSRRPRWAVSLDRLDRPSVSPSVHQLNNCQCHFWIKSGTVEWCADSGRRGCRSGEVSRGWRGFRLWAWPKSRTQTHQLRTMDLGRCIRNH